MPSLVAGWIAVSLLAGCATVAPYERERLARRDMELERNGELRSGEQHATAYREGSSGAEGARTRRGTPVT